MGANRNIDQAGKQGYRGCVFFRCSTSGVWVFSRQAPPSWIRLEHHLGDLSSETSSLPVRLADQFLIQDLWSERGLMPIHDVGVCGKDARSSLPLHLSSSSSLDSLFCATSDSWAGLGLSTDPWRIFAFLDSSDWSASSLVERFAESFTKHQEARRSQIRESSPHLRRLTAGQHKDVVCLAALQPKNNHGLCYFSCSCLLQLDFFLGTGIGDDISASLSFPGVRKHGRLGVGTANAHHSQTGPRKAVEK